MSENAQKIPGWYWAVVIIMLLWNLMGISSFFLHINPGEEYLAGLPEAEAALYDQYPLWTKIVFAISVFSGLVGCIGLMLRKGWTKNVFIISLVAIIIQFSHSLFMTDSMEVYGTVQSLFMPLLVTVIAIFLIWFAGYAEKKGIIVN